MRSNFDFLGDKFPLLAQLGETAERYLHSDPNSCLIKLGMLAETMVNIMLQLDSIAPPENDNTHLSRLRLLSNEGLLPKDIADILHAMRLRRNEAVHQGYDSFDDCLTHLELAYSLSVWFMQTYGDWGYTPSGFNVPVRSLDQEAYERMLQEKEILIAQLTAEVSQLSAASALPRIERAKKAQTAADRMNLTERETRLLIDDQLRKVGWEADTVSLRYAKGARPEKGKNLAIAEWPIDGGYADYAFFAGLRLVGVVEAKKAHTDVPSVLDHQCKEYSRGIKAEHVEYQIGTWNGHRVPFLFATNGRKYLKQLETKSGIWFLDVRQSSNIPRALQGWMSPMGMLEMLQMDVVSTDSALKNMPTELLRDKDGLNLRDYQIEAIQAAEEAIVSGTKNVLLAMATGTGKTRTVLGMIYRFLKSGRFRRVLFLVDRNALGAQAQDVFKEVKLEDLMTLHEIYEIKDLEEADIERETKVHVSTVQGMVRRVLLSEKDTLPSVTDYDLIVVDEAHRGYLLDREMSDDELLYRDQADYVSKYRNVVEYFDAVNIALTATPALHTTTIFGKPVFSYTYRQAVIDGYLVDHDAPHTLITRLSEGGITFEAGDTVPIYDPVTGEITNSAELEDELKFEVEDFNRKVITENFNRTVLTEIARHLNPEENGKTLIYAVDDSHADLIVNILKEIYEPLGVDNEAIMKITGSVGGGNRKRVLEAVKRFKNEKYPSIAVTVDLLTTGIDVPEITTLVFMRRVKSRILFEQMMGRATRLCPEIGKTHFEIYDPVGVYESLEDVSTMRPVVANPTATFDDLLDSLEVLKEYPQTINQIELIVARLNRKNRKLSELIVTHFTDLSGGETPAQFTKRLRSLPATEAKTLLLNSRSLLALLDGKGPVTGRPMVISDKEDELLSHTRGYGNGLRPQDYLDEFTTFITNNINNIAALKVVCTRPGELTRESLKSLRLELDRHGFTEKLLNTAWQDLTNEEIVADIISFIRRAAIGSPLISHEERIRNAVRTLRDKHQFSKMELDWLNRIEAHLLHETVLDAESFEIGAFRTHGGFARINRIFGNRLGDILQELNTYLYDDGGKTA